MKGVAPAAVNKTKHQEKWLGFGAFIARARVQSLVRELRPHELCSVAKNKQKNTRRIVHFQWVNCMV